MTTPIFSVIIPAYNQAEFLPATIQSVLDQSMTDFEIIVINDASPDNTNEIIQKFSDSRIRLIEHTVNKRLPATRNTGIQAARGNYIAFLDADDLFHPKKLEAHNKFLNENPDIDVTYNSRFELNYSETTIRGLVRPPKQVGLRDFIAGYPFTPSDMVVRKNVVLTEGGFDESLISGGEDLEYPARLALAHCKFARVDQALNYRRHHARQYRQNLDARLKDVQIALKKIYRDSRCPDEIRKLGELPLTENYLVVSYLAFIQNRTEEGQNFFRRLVQINPTVLHGTPCLATNYFINNSTADENEDHEEILRTIFDQLPELSVNIQNQLNEAIQYGYLIKGVRAAIWDRPQASIQHFKNAANTGAQFSEINLNRVAQQLLDYEVEMGTEALQKVLRRLLPQIRKLSETKTFQNFMGELHARRAFENFQQRHLKSVPQNVITAFWNRPRFLFNRGMLSILIKSLLKKSE